MRDVELYQQLLGVVSTWTVNRVELSVEAERVDVWVKQAPEVRCPAVSTKHPAGSFEARPDCDRNLPELNITDICANLPRRPPPTLPVPKILAHRFSYPLF